MSVDVIDLLHTVQAPHMTVDPRAAMTHGRRMRLRRRAVLVGMAAAVAAAIALGTQVAGRDDSRPATPAPGQRLTISADPMTGKAPDFSITADWSASTRVVTVTVEDTGGNDLGRGTTRLPRGVDVGWLEVSPAGRDPLRVLIAPRDGIPNAVPSSTFAEDLWTAHGVLNGAGLAAWARPLDPRDVGRTAAVYTYSPGKVGVFSDRSPLARARMGEVTMWVNWKHGVQGYTAPDGSSADVVDPSELRQPRLRSVGGSTVLAGSTFVSTLAATGFLPPGASNVSIQPTGSMPTGLSLRSAPFDDGSGVAVYLTRKVSMKTEEAVSFDGVAGVRWTDAAGATHVTPLG